MIIENVPVLVTILESLDWFSRFNIFWCSIDCIMLLRLINLNKSLKEFFWCFFGYKKYCCTNGLLKNTLYLFALINLYQWVENNFVDVNNRINFLLYSHHLSIFQQVFNMLLDCFPWIKEWFIVDWCIKIFDLYQLHVMLSKIIYCRIISSLLNKRINNLLVFLNFISIILSKSTFLIVLWVHTYFYFKKLFFWFLAHVF